MQIICNEQVDEERGWDVIVFVENRDEVTFATRLWAEVDVRILVIEWEEIEEDRAAFRWLRDVRLTLTDSKRTRLEELLAPQEWQVTVTVYVEADDDRDAIDKATHGIHADRWTIEHVEEVD